MAGGRIKGITVEIGGDTTGLEKALKGVNSTIRNTQTQLKDVERLLKLDPTHTELLNQKQKLLKESIGATKEKLDTLKAAQEQAKAQLENGTLGADKYDALQREIIATEEELARLAKEAANANTALTKIGAVGETLENVGGKMTSVGRTLTTHVTAPIVALGTAAVKTTADFDAQMSKVQAISGATGEDFDALRDKAREMGAKTKFSATEAGEAFEYMAMAGWKTGDMLDGIEGLMALAAASGEDLGTTADIVTDALTAFGLTAADSGHFADVLAAASSNANTNVSMMGETFKYAAPIAGALGFSVEDTAEAIGLMANAGIKGSQAGTALRTIMNNLTGPITLVGENLGEVTIQTTNTDGSMRDLSDILGDCRTAFSQLSESEQAQAAEALVGKNAMSGFLALMNAAPADIEKLSDAIENCDGTAASMAETMQDNLSGQITILKSALQELAIQIGDALMPTVRKIVAHIQAFVEKLQNMDEGTRNTILKVAAFAAAIGPAILVLGKLTTGVGKGLKAVSKLGKGILTLTSQAKLGVGAGGALGKALGALAGPVGIVIAVIAVLVAAFVHLWKTNEEFRNKVTAIWEGVKAKFQAFAQGIVQRLNALGFSFKDITEVLSALWNGFCELLAPVFEAAFEVISAVLGTVLDVLTGLLDVFIGVFTGNWEQAWEGVKEIFSGIWEGIKSIFSSVLKMLKGLADTFLGWFGTDWETVWSSIKSFFTDTWKSIKTFFSNTWTSIKTTASNAWNGIKTTVINIGNGIKTGVTNAWNTLKTNVTNAVNAVKTTVSNVWSTIKSTVTTIATGIQSAVSTAWNTLKTNVTNAVNALKTALSTVWNSIKSTVTSIATGIQTAVSTAWNTLKTNVTNTVNAVKTAVSNAWNSIKTTVTAIATGIQTAVSTAWNTLKTNVSNTVNAVKTTLSTVWNSIKTTVTTIATGIQTAVTTAWNTLKTNVTSAVNALQTTLSTVWNSIKTTVTTIATGIQTAVTNAFNTLKTNITNAVHSIQTTVTNVWNSIKTTVSNIATGIQTGVTNAWNTLKTNVSNAVSSIQTTATNTWNSIKTSVSNIATGIQTNVTSAWNTAKTNISTALSGIQTTASTVWTNIKTTVGNTVSGIGTSISTGFNTAKNTVSSIFSSIQTSISNAVNGAKNAVQTAIDRIKGIFNFSWSLPSLKLPHVSITGSFSLSPPSVPHFSISWYKKAMENGMILNSPTIFGTKGNTLLAGGEAGSETVVGTQSLLGMIRDAVASMAGGTTINYGGVNINLYATENQDIRALADEIEYRLANNITRRKAAYGG